MKLEAVLHCIRAIPQGVNKGIFGVIKEKVSEKANLFFLNNSIVKNTTGTPGEISICFP